jgi:hypothetical protein
MAIAFRRLNYKGLRDQPSWCDAAICRCTFGATVLLEDCIDNPGTLVGHYIEGLATMLWQIELYDLDAGMIRWFQLRGKDLNEVKFSIVPDNRGGFFGMPQWENVEPA